MAGQLLTDLKSAEKTRKTPSHEARLGILVITILVFAFGFLVYHKMDLHQRKLTEASINPSASSSTADIAAGEFSEFTANSSTAGDAATDPLIKATELSSGSPFAESTETLGADSSENSFPATGGGSTGSGQTEILTAMQDSPVAEPAFPEITPSSNEPVAADEKLPEFQFTEPAESDTVQIADSKASSADAASDVDSFPVAVIESASNDQTMQPSGEPQEDALPTLIADASTSGDSGSPSAEVLASELSGFSDDSAFPQEAPQAVNAPQPNTASIELPKEENPFGQSSSADESATMQLVAEEEPPALNSSTKDLPTDATAEENPFSTPDASATVQIPQSANDTAEATPSLPLASAEQTLKAEEPEPLSGRFDTPESKPENQEPVMIAMAEPQEGNPFSGGFAPDEESQPVSKAPAAEPSFDGGAFPQSSGFNAVTNPGVKPKNQVVRNAAGSGADGKFSLAAFNYQNEAVEAAPDDGSTYESVVVQPGDNYSKISKRVYGSVRYFSALAVFNQHRISDPKKMRAGMIVLTPAASVLEERYPQLFIDSKPKVAEPAGFLLMDDGSPAYRVGERETLSQISERFLGRSSRWVEIYRLNQNVVTDPNKLKAGTILALPEDATEVSVTP